MEYSMDIGLPMVQQAKTVLEYFQYIRIAVPHQDYEIISTLLQYNQQQARATTQ